MPGSTTRIVFPAVNLMHTWATSLAIRLLK